VAGISQPKPMTLLEHIAQNIVAVYDGENWTESTISNTLKDISLEEAQRTTPGSKNTIASLLHHITYWNRIMVIRLGGTAVKAQAANGFDVQPMLTAADWKDLKEDNLKSAYELADAVKVVNDEDLLSDILPDHSSAFKNIIGISEHTHYHLGQIVILKNLLRSFAKPALQEL
jgi:uncharacterized damage-inducible protein DinB